VNPGWGATRRGQTLTVEIPALMQTLVLADNQQHAPTALHKYWVKMNKSDDLCSDFLIIVQSRARGNPEQVNVLTARAATGKPHPKLMSIMSTR